jgi:hypothetical protein
MRPKGTPNKIGAQVKENVVAVFTRLGGTAGMAEWAKENLTEFYRLYAKLIPSEVTGSIDFRDVTELSRSELLLIASGSSQRVTEERRSEGELSEVH